MAVMLPDGRAAEMPTMPKRPRGRTLDAASVRRLRDLLCFILIHVVKLSPEDTLRVMQPVHPDHLARRLRGVPIKPRQAASAFQMLLLAKGHGDGI